MTAKEFGRKYWPAAKLAAFGTGIFPETVITMAALESNNGNSELARKADNFFGIKADRSWKGPIINLPTTEEKNGKRVATRADFRKYSNPADSFRDLIRFLQVNPRYTSAGVFQAKTPNQQFDRLQLAGYATASNYATALKSRRQALQLTNSGGFLVPAALGTLIALFAWNV